MSQANMVLHCGARRVSRQELIEAPCPPAEGRWHPVPHIQVLEHCEQALSNAGYVIENTELGLSKTSERFFGTLTLKAPLASGVNLAVGIRSSTDKSISLQWACGSRVFVCDNLAFSSSVVIARKHTTHGVTRYQEAICKAVSELTDYREYEAFRIRQMQATPLTNEQAESVLLRAFEAQILGNTTALATALDEWRKPTYCEFEERNAWSLYNAITFALSPRVQRSPQGHAAATIKLGRMLLPEASAPAQAA